MTMLRDPVSVWPRTVRLAVFLIFSLMLLLGGTLYYYSEKDRIRVEMEKDLAAIADLKVSEFVQWWEQRKADGEVLRVNRAFAEQVALTLRSPPGSGRWEEMKGWAQRVGQALKYRSVILLDTEGVPRLGAGEDADRVTEVTRQAALEAVRTRQVTTVDLHVGVGDRIALNVLAPLLTGASDREVAAVVLLRTDPEAFLYPFIQKWPTPSPTGETLLVRQEGEELLYLNEVRHVRGAALSLRRPLSTPELIAAEGIRGQAGLVEGVDYRGVPAVGVVRKVPGTSWFLVAKVDAEEINHLIRSRVWNIGLFLGLFLFAAGTTTALWEKQHQARLFRSLYETEEQLRVSQSLLDAVVEATTDAVYVKDRDGRYLLFNKAASRITGRSPDEVLGKDDTFLFPRAEAETVMAGDRRVMDSPAPLTYEERVTTANGEVRTFLSTKGRVVLGPSRAPALYGIARDITALKRAEERLALSEARFRRLFEAAKDGILILDAQSGVIAEANPYIIELVGSTREEILGKHLWDIGFLGDSLAIRSAFTELKEKGYIRYENLPLATRSGEPVEVEFVSNRYDVEGKMVIQCNIRDITARRKAERALEATREELERKNRELEAFTRTAAHDLRQPITVISGYIQHLQKVLAPSLDSRHQEIFKVLLGSINYLNRFLEDLLVLSRLDVPHPPAERVSVAPLLGQIARGYQEDLAGSDWEWRVEEGLPAVLLPATRAWELFNNLFSNSVKYRRTGVPLLVEVGVSPQDLTAPADQRMFFFRDNGKGIAHADQPKVFDLFFRAEQETATGTGLGLAIVKGIVEKAGGTIRLESAPGVGTTFFFTLPVAG